MQAISIVLFAIASACAYGIVHDQVTAHLCVEYFTIGHPPVFPTESPTLLAFGWGVLATWWVGLSLGIPLAIAARAGSRPKLGARDVARPIVVLLLVMAVASLVSGVTGFFLARSGVVWLVEPLASRVPREKHVAFLADGFAHGGAYAVGFLGGVVVCVKTWRRRGRALSTADVAPGPVGRAPRP